MRRRCVTKRLEENSPRQGFFGTEVHAVDGQIGHVEEFYFDDAQWKIRYLVVDTGSWLTRHPVLISPEAVKRNWGLAGFNVTLTREQVRNSPEIDPQRALSRITFRPATARSGTSTIS